MKKLSIFFDTNIIESRFSFEKAELMFHHAITPSDIFNKILKYIKTNDIEKITNLYIPDISWKEYQKHLIDNYISNEKYIQDQVNAYKKAFGEILDLSYRFIHENVDKYKEYLSDIQKDFLEKTKCQIISYPKDVYVFEDLVEKCINRKQPFKTAHANKKEYHDAGLKDALIWETIIQHQREHDCICIFVTSDNDFVSTDGIHVSTQFEDFCKFLEDKGYVVNTNFIKRKIENDDYLKASIISETGNAYDESVTEFGVIDVKEEGDLYNVSIKAVINETIYNIRGTYDISPNELLDINFEIENE